MNDESKLVWPHFAIQSTTWEKTHPFGLEIRGGPPLDAHQIQGELCPV